MDMYVFSTEFTTAKGCAPVCVPGTVEVAGVKTTMRCCDTDLCNAAGIGLCLIMR